MHPNCATIKKINFLNDSVLIKKFYLPAQHWIAYFLQIGHRHLSDRVQVDLVQLTLTVGEVVTQT